jgi:hypothetical protein
MSTQLHTAISSILAMPYFKNDHACSGSHVHGHEDAVAEKIKASGFTEEQRTNYPKLSKSVLSEWAKSGETTELETILAKMPDSSYIVQPAGSQGFPDILVKDVGGRYVAIECKSGKNGVCPMWNDNTPKPLAIYVLSSGAEDATTIFMGKDVITPEEQALMDELEEKLSKVVKTYTNKLKAIDTFKRGWIQKARKQHFQGGGKDKTNYFTHTSRQQCENNALNYAKQ